MTLKTWKQHAPKDIDVYRVAVPENYVGVVLLNQSAFHAIPAGGNSTGFFLAFKTFPQLLETHKATAITTLYQIFKGKQVWKGLLRLFPAIAKEFENPGDGSSSIKALTIRNVCVFFEQGFVLDTAALHSDCSAPVSAGVLITAACALFGLRAPVYPSNMPVINPPPYAGAVYPQLDYKPDRDFQVVDPMEALELLDDGWPMWLRRVFGVIQQRMPDEKWVVSPEILGVSYWVSILTCSNANK